MNCLDLSPPFYVRADDPLAASLGATIARRKGPAFDFVERVRNENKSMLAHETLAAIHFLASQTEGAILEIGAYIGGATMTILDATRARRNPLVTLEEPVASDHPHLPTEDSVQDLLLNIEAFGLARPEHRVVPGASFESWVIGDVYAELMGREVSLVIWDADSSFDRDYFLYGRLFADDCVVMIDDYMVEGQHKADRITVVIDDMVERGLLEPLALLPWSTWFGRLARRPNRADFEHFQAQWRVLAAAGDVYYERWLGYADQNQRAKYMPPLTKDERMDFWHRAAAKNAPAK